MIWGISILTLSLSLDTLALRLPDNPVNLCLMREGVGVKNPSLKKMAEMISLQGFYGFFVFIASRTLHSQGFSYFNS